MNQETKKHKMEPRPFTTNSFEHKIFHFKNLINELTFRQTELSYDERRAKVIGKRA